MTTFEIILLALVILLFVFAVIITAVFIVKGKKNNNQQVTNKVVEGNDPLTAVNTNVNNIVTRMDKLSEDITTLQANVNTIKSHSESIPEIQNSSKTIVTAKANIDTIMETMGKVVKDFASLNTNVDNIKANAASIPEIKNSSKRIDELLLGTQSRGKVAEEIIGTYLREMLGSNGLLKEQVNVANDGRELNIDFLIQTENQKILIDAKFPSNNYLKLVESSDEPAKFEQAKEAFRKDITNKVKDLQKYINHYDKRDYVIMCLPSDSMYITMIDEFKESFIYEILKDKKIAIVSPAILIPLVHLILEQDKVEKVYKQYNEKFENMTNLFHAMKNWCDSWENILKAFSEVTKKVVEFNKKQSTLIVKCKKIESSGEEIAALIHHKDSLKETNASLTNDSQALKDAQIAIKNSKELDEE